jgi:UDP-3-O-[3-hydroxymyristoyl] glucosamine N-acyltransferase
MEHAGPEHLTFLANPKYAPKVKHTKASAILVSEALAGVEIACLVSENPYLDFARALALFYQPPRPAPGIHPLAYVAATRWWARTAPSARSRWWGSACAWAAMRCCIPTW